MALGSTAWAQDYKVEIAPFVGYTFSEGFTIDPVVIGGQRFTKVNPVSGYSYGVGFDVYLNENIQVGFQLGQQDSALEAKGTTKREFADLKVRNYHGIFTFNFADEDDSLRPFIFGGLGATQYAPGDVEGRNIEGSTKFSFTWGGGVKAYAGRNFGIKVVGRWTPTYIKSDPSGIWCSPWWPWGCYVLEETDYSNQFELAGGVIFRF
jgi:opacity protein-like surface antigen